LVAPFDKQGNLLLLKRDEQQHCGGLWSFPGGKVEIGEQAQQAAIRELKEETGLNAHGWHFIGQSSFTYPDRLLHFVLYACLCDNLTLLDTEAEYVWTNTDDLSNYPMPEANVDLINMLVAIAAR